jgi:hypothetical protein
MSKKLGTRWVQQKAVMNPEGQIYVAYQTCEHCCHWVSSWKDGDVLKGFCWECFSDTVCAKYSGSECEWEDDIGQWYEFHTVQACDVRDSFFSLEPGGWNTEALIPVEGAKCIKCGARVAYRNYGTYDTIATWTRGE